MESMYKKQRRRERKRWQEHKEQKQRTKPNGGNWEKVKGRKGGHKDRKGKRRNPENKQRKKEKQSRTELISCWKNKLLIAEKLLSFRFQMKGVVCSSVTQTLQYQFSLFLGSQAGMWVCGGLWGSVCPPPAPKNDTNRPKSHQTN